MVPRHLGEALAGAAAHDCGHYHDYCGGGDSALGHAKALFPNCAVSSLQVGWSQGGVRRVNVDCMLTALQAKLVARLLEPGALFWKQILSRGCSGMLGAFRFASYLAVTDCPVGLWSVGALHVL